MKLSSTLVKVVGKTIYMYMSDLQNKATGSLVRRPLPFNSDACEDFSVEDDEGEEKTQQ